MKPLITLAFMGTLCSFSPIFAQDSGAASGKSLALSLEKGNRYSYRITLQDPGTEQADGANTNALPPGALAFRFVLEVGRSLEDDEKNSVLRVDINRLVTDKESGELKAEDSKYADIRAIVGRRGKIKDIKNIPENDPMANMVATFVECISGCGLHRDLDPKEEYRLAAYSDAFTLAFDGEKSRNGVDVAHFKLTSSDEEKARTGVANYRMKDGWLEHLRTRVEAGGRIRVLTIERVPNLKN